VDPLTRSYSPAESNAAPMGSRADLAMRGRPLMICLFGGFRVLQSGREVPLRAGGKSAILLSSLAIRERYRASRESLLGTLWPDTDEARSMHSLSSLIHGLRQTFGDALGGESPVIHAAGGYELNVGAGVGVDVADYEAFVQAGERQVGAGDVDSAVSSWLRAVALYRGDLEAVDDLRMVVERERLRATYLTLLGSLADSEFGKGRYRPALAYALRLLSHDPCREDAHRLVMRCHVRLGERAQAWRQYRTCQRILAAEFEAFPELSTKALFDRVRLDPASV
jgi:DNA-binding SARP family transcriptional activator